MVTIGFRPARRERLADILYEQILEQITVGIFGEGDRLPSENEICRAFEVSRPVVREALMRLQADGILVSRQGVGTFVKHRPEIRSEAVPGMRDETGAIEAIEILSAIEIEAARLAARRRTPSHLGVLDEIVESFAAASNELSVRRAELAFYRGVADASGNRHFVQHLDHLLSDQDGQASRHLAVRLNSMEKMQTSDEYRLVLRAIRDGDPDTAGVMMHFHMVRVRGRLMTENAVY